ncbi:MAG: hypothetical protein O9255_06770, partial [Silanimonas sp.]|nr:hypothetical protein [Silanimonas sp.]
MDERIGRLKTSKDAKEFAKNANRLGRPDLEEQANRRAHQLRAVEDGYSSPAQVAIAEALYAYEDQRSVLEGKSLGLSNELCNRDCHSAASGTRSSPNINWKLCSAGFQWWIIFQLFDASR